LNFGITVVLVDAAAGAELARLDHDSQVWTVAFSPDGAVCRVASRQLPTAGAAAVRQVYL
jgi:hypothetical protein